MKPSLRTKLEQLSSRLEELNALLAAEDATRDLDRFRALSKEHAELDPIVARFRDFARSEADIAAAEELARDPDMREFAGEERAKAETTRDAIADELTVLLLPKDPSDERNVFLEIRAGTGGDESALFAGDLLRMYTRYAERQRWKVELVSESPSDLGGYKEVIVRIAGAGVYAKLKFESGGHSNRHVSGVRCGRAAHQQDGFGGAHHAPADGHRRRVPRRSLAAPQSRAGDVGSRFPASRPRAQRKAAERSFDAQIADRLG